MKEICILLATYNGEKYLKEQLESIFAQTIWEHCCLFVRDDGSTDKTVAILKEYETQQKLILVCGENWGFVQNFFWLLNNAPQANFYAFTDQDDIWYPQKLERSLNLLKIQSDINTMPYLYCCDYDYWFTETEIQKRAKHHTLIPSFASALTINIAAGFTCVINQKLKKLVTAIPAVSGMTHDYIMYLTAVSMGKVLYDDFSAAKYRRHSQTTTKTLGSKKEFITYLVKRYFTKTIKNDQIPSIQAFSGIYKDQINPQDRTILSAFLSNSFSARILKFFYPHRYRDSLYSDVFVRFLILCNRF